MELSRKIMTVEELARYLKVHPSTVYRMLRRKELPAFKIARDWRFSLESIDKWLEGRERDSTSTRTDSIGAGNGAAAGADLQAKT